MLELYDITTDLRRAVTQADVDELQRCRQAFGMLVRLLRNTGQTTFADIATQAAQGRITYSEAEARLSRMGWSLEHTA